MPALTCVTTIDIVAIIIACFVIRCALRDVFNLSYLYNFLSKNIMPSEFLSVIMDPRQGCLFHNKICRRRQASKCHQLHSVDTGKYYRDCVYYMVCSIIVCVTGMEHEQGKISIIFSVQQLQISKFSAKCDDIIILIS